MSHHSPAEPPSRTGTTSHPEKERTHGQSTDLREEVDVVIGGDTHVHSHSAAVMDSATGGVLDEITVEATTESYAELVGSPTTTRRRGRGRAKGPAVTAPG